MTKLQRSKHIDVKYHFIRSEIQTGTTELKYAPTDENVADIFTKPATKHQATKIQGSYQGKVVVRMSYTHDIGASGGVRYVL